MYGPLSPVCELHSLASLVHKEDDHNHQDDENEQNNNQDKRHNYGDSGLSLTSWVNTRLFGTRGTLSGSHFDLCWTREQLLL